MAEQAFKKGDTVWVYARIFDSEQEKWSETNPLVGGPNTKLWGVVLRKKKDGWYDIKFELDKKSSIISHQHLNAVYEGLRCRSDGKVVDSRDIEEVRDEVSEESEHESGRDDASSEEEEEIELDRNVEIDWEFEKLVNDAAPANKLYSHVNPSLRTAQREVQGAHDVLWQMWQRFFPENYAREIIVECTNQHAVGDQEWKEPLTLDEFYTYLGILLYMSVIQLSDDRRVYWSLSQYDAGVFSSPQLGQYMPRRRFELITKHLTLGDNGDPTDKLRYYREWLNAVRDQFLSAINAGREIVLDETMIVNKNIEKAVALTYISRKPQPWGHEFWTVVCAISGVLLWYELNEGKEVTRKAKYYEQYGATTATTLRLTEPFQNRGRIVYIDSWFQSVKSCTALLERKTYSVGIVKTAHRNYPRETLDRDCEEEAGATSGAWHQTDDGDVVYACQWRSSRHHKLTMLCSAYSCRRAATDYVTVSGRSVPQPVCVKQWYENYGGVDAFNHTRVGADGFGLERIVRVHNNPNFPLFLGLLGFIETNVFKALRHFSDGYKDVSHNQVRMELTNMMLLRMGERESATQRAKRQATAIAADHTVARYSKQNGQLRCAICGTKTVYVCAYCDSTRGICKPGKMLTDGTPSQCWTEHLKDGKLPKPKRTRT